MFARRSMPRHSLRAAMGLRASVPARSITVKEVRERNALFSRAGLSNFNEAELRLAHARLLTALKESAAAEKKNEGPVVEGTAEAAAAAAAKAEAEEAVRAVERVAGLPASTLQDFDVFKQRVLLVADMLDPRIYVLAGTFFATGLSIGVVIPILPVLVSTIGLTSSQFSVVVASFALSKLIGGIPSGSWANVYGRRRILVAGTAICALGKRESLLLSLLLS